MDKDSLKDDDDQQDRDSDDLTHHVRRDFASTLQTVYRRLQSEDTYLFATSQVLLCEAGLMFLCVRCELQRDFDHSQFRRALAGILGVRSFDLLQVIGDSGSAFSLTGRKVAADVMKKWTGPKTVIEYGYTATLHDTNWIVNDVLEGCHMNDGRVVGSLVAESGTAVERWGCEASSLVGNFVLAYHGMDDGEKSSREETKFGDDMWLSDLVMVAGQGDRIICLEGGVQSFEQLVNVLGKRIPVVAITGSGMRSDGRRRFSAAELIHKLVDCYQHDSSRKALGRVGREYLEQWEELRHKPTQYTRVENALDRFLTKDFDGELVSVVMVS